MTFCDMVKTGGRCGLSRLSRGGARETQVPTRDGLGADSSDQRVETAGHQGPKKIMPTGNSAGRSEHPSCKPYCFQSSVLRLRQGQGSQDGDARITYVRYGVEMNEK